MPDVTLAIKKNGGAATAGGVTAVVGDTIQPTALDKSGWASNPAPRWELWIYEPGSEGTYASWTQDASSDPTMLTLYALGIADPPSFNLPAAGLYELRLIYGGGLTVSTAIVRVAYSNGAYPIGPDETSEFGGAKRGAFKTINDNFANVGSALWDGTPGANLTDADAAITLSASSRRLLPAATLTADRVLTLNPSTANKTLLITREDLTAHTYTLLNGGPAAGNVAVMPAGVRSWAIVESDGTNVIHRASGVGLGT